MKFVLVFHNNGVQYNIPIEQANQEWGMWFGQIGEKLVDGGNPFESKAMSVMLNETKDITENNSAASGYSIIEAKNFDEAVEIAKGCPMLKHTDGKGAVHVYQAMPM